MATLLVRDLDDDLVARLKQRARTHGRSAEAEHRAILESALALGREEFIARAKRLQERTRGHESIDSAEIIRAYRDRGLPEEWKGRRPSSARLSRSNGRSPRSIRSRH